MAAANPVVGVIGAGRCDAATQQRAHDVGARLADAGYVVVENPEELERLANVNVL